MNRNQYNPNRGNQDWQNRPPRRNYGNSGPDYFGANDRYFPQENYGQQYPPNYQQHYGQHYTQPYQQHYQENYPQNYRQNFEGDYYGEDPRYSHPSRFRSDSDYQRRKPLRDQELYNPAYDRNRNEVRTSDTVSSRNYGSMGSYGGAQGYGSSSNGYSSSNWGSGHQGSTFQPRHAVYGAYRDKNSFAEGEQPGYDGSQRYGSQGADSSRRSRYSAGPGRYTTAADESRYGIYDTAESQYNHGEYGNPTRGTESGGYDQHSHQKYAPQSHYGSRQHSASRQGSGYDQYGDAGDLDYGNTAGPLNRAYYYEDIDRHAMPYYNDRTGENWGYQLGA